jgi:hypothetical protein
MGQNPNFARITLRIACRDCLALISRCIVDHHDLVILVGLSQDTIQCFSYVVGVVVGWDANTNPGSHLSKFFPDSDDLITVMTS